MSGSPRLAKDVCNTYHAKGYRPAPDNDETIVAATGHRVTCGIPLIWCHGAAGNGLTLFNSYPENRAAPAFVRREPSGVVVIASEFGSGLNWGNADAMNAIDDAIAWSAARFGTRTDKVAIGGTSMGGCTSLNWAWRNPGKVVAWAGHIPLINLTWLYDNTSYAPFIQLGFSSWLSLPGVATAYASTPDHASFDITGDIDIRADVAADDWVAPTNQTLISKYAAGQRSYKFRINSNGRLQIMWTVDGTTELSMQSTAAPSVTDGGRLRLRVTLDVNNGSGGRTATFYTALKHTDETGWTRLGNPVTVAATTSIFSGTAPLHIGVAEGAEPFAGKVFSAEIRNSIGGSSVTTPNFETQEGNVTSFDAPTGRTWTVNGTAFIHSTYEQERTSRDPYLNQAAIAAMGVPMAAWYGLIDDLCPPEYVEALAATVGSNFELFSHNEGHTYKATNDDAFVIADWLVPKMLAADV